ncbi:MAG TPA: FtsX-like permease family protein [Actinocrinis sp.]|nr:FtsX-like permease family protein [Actinocrinis sp.]
MTAAWIRDLRLGLRFACSGREGWARTLLTALGTGLAVALLFLAASVPGLVHDRTARTQARTLDFTSLSAPAGPGTLLVSQSFTTYRGATLSGTILKAEGSRPPIPPGLGSLPGDGEMDVSPALGRLLASPQGALLRPRLPYRTVGTVGDAGLLGPQDLVYFAGNASMRADTDFVYRVDRIGTSASSPTAQAPTSPVLILLTILSFVFLLIPVAVFIAAAVRFGGERRDRRLAALRLVGTDIRGTHRIAAGEALAGALLGLVGGIGAFFLGRQLAGRFAIGGSSVFPADLNPNPLAALVIVLAVPVVAVAVTSFALRSVAVEPLGVVRRTALVRRRLWWRLLPPAVGVAILTPAVTDALHMHPTEVQLSAGVALVLTGLAVLLPWGLERTVSRLGRGPLPIQLGSRRLQMSGAAASRAVGGITVAVAGAIAAQTLFGGVVYQFTASIAPTQLRAQVSVLRQIDSQAQADQLAAEMRVTRGVKSVTTEVQGSALPAGHAAGADAAGYAAGVSVTVADCADLAQFIKAPDCKAGSVYEVPQDGSLSFGPAATGAAGAAKLTAAGGAGPGTVFDLDVSGDFVAGPVGAHLWTVPAGVQGTTAVPSPNANIPTGIFATPQALPAGALDAPSADALVALDPAVPDAIEYVQNAAAAVDPLSMVYPLVPTSVSPRYTAIEHGLTAGAAVTLLLIALSLAVSTIEQLRERRKLLSVLVAFGTRRSTLAWSVLWQSAVPVVFGLILALGAGLGLGALLLRIAAAPITFDWPVILALLGAGAGAVAVTTLLSLPALWRMMRPDGLRTE